MNLILEQTINYNSELPIEAIFNWLKSDVQNDGQTDCPNKQRHLRIGIRDIRNLYELINYCKKVI